MLVEIIKPYGYCKGVVDALVLALDVKKQHPLEDVYILGMLVHNEEVIKLLDEHNIVTLYDKTKSQSELLATIKNGIVIFTAHGHDSCLEIQAKNQGLIFFDATCHFVKNNHQLIKDAITCNRQVIFIGKKHHPETVASLAISNNVFLYDVIDGLDFSLLNDEKPVIVTQTTLSILELKRIYEHIRSFFKEAHLAHEVCNATRIRQSSILQIAPTCDLIYVIGSELSSNTKKLYEIACETYKTATIKQIKTLKDVFKRDIENKLHIALVSGASTPKEIVDEIYNYLLSLINNGTSS